MTLQEIFNKLGNRAGVLSLKYRNNIASHCYKHDPFKKGSKALDEFLLTLGLTRHILNDPRLHLIMDLQDVSYLPEAEQMMAALKVAIDYNLHIIVGMKDE